MTTTTSAVTTRLTAAQNRGLNKLGDVCIPGDDVLPSFSRSGVSADIGRMLPYMHEADRSSLLLLLTVCAWLPKPAVQGIVALAAAWRRAPEPIAGLLRMANIGIKGVVHSLYWSALHDQGIHAAIGYDATLNEAAYEASLQPPTAKEKQ